jgi:hypothetical protein
MRNASGFNFSAFISSFIQCGVEPQPLQVSFRFFFERCVGLALPAFSQTAWWDGAAPPPPECLSPSVTHYYAHMTLQAAV